MFVTGKPVVDVKAQLFDRDGLTYNMLAVLLTDHPNIENGIRGSSIRTVVVHRTGNIYESKRTVYRVIETLS